MRQRSPRRRPRADWHWKPRKRHAHWERGAPPEPRRAWLVPAKAPPWSPVDGSALDLELWLALLMHFAAERDKRLSP